MYGNGCFSGQGGAEAVGDAGLESNAAASFALALRLMQLISASCRRLAERKHTAGGLGLWKVSAALPLKCLTSGTLSFHSSVKNKVMFHHLLLDSLLDVHQ